MKLTVIKQHHFSLTSQELVSSSIYLIKTYTFEKVCGAHYNQIGLETLMSFLKNNNQYKTYCFDYQNNIMFFQYNSNHPILMKNLKFELGKIKIFTQNRKLYSCVITSNPHLNVVLEWNEEYFAKLFHGLAFFELEQSGDEDDDSLSLVVRDRFEQNEQIFLMRAKLNEQFGYDLTNQLWNTFTKYNLQKQKSIQTMVEDNVEYRKKADYQLTLLIQLQQKKQQQKIKLKGQLSALLRQKQAKLREYNELFDYHNFTKQSEPSIDLSEQKESMSIAGSLFQESQDFNYFRT